MTGTPGTSMMPTLSDHAALQLQDLAATAALSSATLAPTTAGHVGAASQVAVGVAGAARDEQDGGAACDQEEDDDEDPVTDARRNWGHDMTLKLVKIWKRVCEMHPNAGRVARMQIVYDEFKDAVDCSNRSRKAVEDKLYSVKQMYQFIVKTSGQLHKPTLPGSSGDVRKPAWFELSKDERRVVRSLHCIKIPNISFEVFNVLDSVLNPSPLQTAFGKPDAAVSTLAQVNRNAVEPSRASSHAVNSVSPTTAASLAPPANASTAARSIDRDSTDVVDNKRNWSNEVTLQLARAWHNAVLDNKDIRGAMLSQRVYNEFLKAVGSCSRSRKAIEDKMHSMKEMYRFIRLYNAGCMDASDKPLWFNLSKPDRRHIRNAHKIRVPNLTPEVYTELDSFMSQAGDAGGDTFPEGFSRLLAAQQNLSMAAISTLSPATSSTGTSNGSDQPTGVANSLNAALTTTYEVMRRLAEEENQLPPASMLMMQPAQVAHTSALPSATVLSTATVEPPAKRQRTTAAAASSDAAPTRVLTTDQRLQELLALQQHAMAERRQQHAEQMVLLLEIVGLLRQQQQQQATPAQPPPLR